MTANTRTLRLLDDLLDRADHVEGHLRQMVELTVQDLGEALDGFLQRHQLAGVAGEHLGDLERLRQEALDLAGAGDRQLVLLGQLIHTQDGDDVLERLVVLQDLLHATGDVVVLGADDVRVHDTRGRIERIDRRVDAQLGDGTRQHGGGVQVSEGGGRSRIGQIVSGHVDGLHRRDRALLRGGDALLHATHVRGQGRLVTDGRRDTTQQGRHLRTGLGEAEDVVDEQQHILTLLVAEVLGHGQAGQRDTGTGARRLVHLAVHQRDLGRLVLQRDDTTLNHLVVQIVTLAGALADAGKHGVATVRLGDVVNQLHDEYGLADAGTTEQADLAALRVRGQQVHHLDARHQDLLLDAHLDELGRLGVDRRRQVRVDRAALIDRLADHVNDATERLRPDRDTDGRTGVQHALPTHQTLRTVHGDGAHRVLTQMLRNLQHQSGAAALHLQRVQNRGQLLVELHVHDGTDDGHYLTLRSGRGIHRRLCRVGSKLTTSLQCNRLRTSPPIRRSLCQAAHPNGALFQISDDKIQKYLERLRLEYYALKVQEQRTRKDIQRMLLLSNVVEMYEQRKIIVDNLSSLKELKDDKDDEMVQLLKEEREAYGSILFRLDSEILNGILSMDDEEDYGSLIMEVTAGVGGQEAMLFARELFDMYCGYVEYKGWEVEMLQTEDTDIGGTRHATTVISGPDAYRYLKHEGGVHRVQRIPATEKSGRIHTSTVTVSIIPRPDDFQVELKEKDLKIETKRASGAGGQHVNTTDSAVRIVHLPTGIAVECQTERSQQKNREIAKQKLTAKLMQIELEARFSSTQALKKSQVGQSLRNEKIRTYNFNQDRITDHRIEGGTAHNLKGFLEGGEQLDDMIEKLRRSQRRKQLMDIINRECEQ
uniref:Prokaryotic-type class I peptide chain release factors domain-containing protein n=1 Tax=Anopheles quadriannulatus TaxID=34691 RepID=A0A182XR80_ANOQN